MSPRPYSHSAVQSFEQCPRRYKFEKIDKPEVPDVVSADMYMGNAVHRVLRHVYLTAANGRVPTLDSLLAMYAEEWDKPARETIQVPLEQATVEDYINAGRQMLRRYYERYTPFDDGILIGCEMRMTCTLPGTDIRFAGNIDRLWKRPDGVIEIVDYKTGQHFPQGGHDPRFFRQMGLYQLMVQQAYPQFETIELCQYFLRQEEVQRYRAEPLELEELAVSLKNQAIAIQTAVRLDSFPAKEGRHCDFCPYFRLCPAKRHKLILEAEAGSVKAAERTTAESARALADQFLTLHAQLKKLEAEQEALKGDLVQAAKDLEVAIISGTAGAVSVRIVTEEKLPTKSHDEEAFLALVDLARQHGLDDCFELNTRALEALVRKEQLPPDILARFRDYIVKREASRVSAKPPKKTKTDKDEPNDNDSDD